LFGFVKLFLGLCDTSEFEESYKRGRNHELQAALLRFLLHPKHWLKLSATFEQINLLPETIERLFQNQRLLEASV